MGVLGPVQTGVPCAAALDIHPKALQDAAAARRQDAASDDETGNHRDLPRPAGHDRSLGLHLLLLVLLLLALMEAIIPGRPEGPSPESIFTDRGYGFRLPRCAPKSAVADLGNQTPISGKPEIGGPGE